MLTIRLAPTTIILLVLALAGCIEDGSAPTQPIGTPSPSPTVGTEWVLPEPDGEATGLPGECFHGLCLEAQPAVPAGGPAADAGLVLLATQEEDHHWLEVQRQDLWGGTFHDDVYAWKLTGKVIFAYDFSSRSLHWVSYTEDGGISLYRGGGSDVLLQVGQSDVDEKRLATWTVEDGLAWHRAPVYEGQALQYAEPWLVYMDPANDVVALEIDTGQVLNLGPRDDMITKDLEGNELTYYDEVDQSIVVRNLVTGAEERFPVKRENWAIEHFGDGFVMNRANYSGGNIRFETTYHDFASGPRDITGLVGENCNPTAEVYPWLSLWCYPTDDPRIYCGFLNLETEERFVLGNSTFQSDECVADGERFLVVMADAGGHYGDYAVRLYEGRLPGSSSPMNS